jgi:hypothetical protein
MSKDLTEKQRTAMAAAEAARTAGLTLIAHCRAHGLNVREIYDAIAALRRSGVLPKAERSRRRKGEFVSVGLRRRSGDRVWGVATGGVASVADIRTERCYVLIGTSSGSTCTAHRWT